MIDERGRGGEIKPAVEEACGKKLLRAIWEQAVYDAAYLDAFGIEKATLVGNQMVYRDEIENFAKSKWGKFIYDIADGETIDIKAIRRRAENSAYHLREIRRNYDRRVRYTYRGESHTSDEWAEILGVQRTRITEVWNECDGRHNPDHWLDKVGHYRLRTYDYNGKRMSAGEIAAENGLFRSEVAARLERGMTPQEAVEAAMKWREKHPKIIKS